MLHTCSDMLRLDASYHSCTCLSCKIRIFRIILKVTTTERASVDVAGRSKPDTDIIFFYFFRSCFTNFLYQFFIPGAGKKCGTWPGSCVHSAFRKNTKSGWSVCSHHIRDSVFRKISHSKCIGTSCVWLSAKEIDTVIQCQDIHKLIQCHFTICYIREVNSLGIKKIKKVYSFLSSCIRAWKTDGIFILSRKSFFFHIFTLWKFLIRTVRKHTFLKMIWCCLPA